MNDASIAGHPVDPAEQAVRAELARGDMMLARVHSVLLHLLQIEGRDLFSDEVVARVRGISLDVAARLLAVEAGQEPTAQSSAANAGRQDLVAQALVEEPKFLEHVHSLVLEAQLAERLQARSGIDPVAPPLVHDLVASEDPSTASLTMAVLAAQARFMQQQRRMELPLSELPGDLFHKALLLLRPNPSSPGQGERSLRAAYDEGSSRLGLLSQLFVNPEIDTRRALVPEECGISIFATALALASGQERAVTIVSMMGKQAARLILALRAAGLEMEEVRDRLISLHLDALPADGVETLSAESAAVLLSTHEPGAAV